MSTDRTTEMLNYLSAISRDVGEMRQAVARLDEKVSRLDERVEKLEKTLAQVQTDVKEIKLEMRVFSADLRRARVEHEELVDRVAALESREAS